MQVIPLRDRILAVRREATHSTESGLFIPEVARERPQEAEVVAVGPGRPIPELAEHDEGDIIIPTVPPAVAVGDIILREEEILAVLKEDPQ